jgi:hypothetical protein
MSNGIRRIQADTPSVIISLAFSFVFGLAVLCLQTSPGVLDNCLIFGTIWFDAEASDLGTMEL